MNAIIDNFSLNLKTISGTVVQGEKRGRELGFPTANLDIAFSDKVRHGIYACWVELCESDVPNRFMGCCCIGVRPTFGVYRPNLEVFLLDFTGDLYGQEISIELTKFIRPEERFDDVESLILAMNSDVSEARKILSNTLQSDKKVLGDG